MSEPRPVSIVVFPDGYCLQTLKRLVTDYGEALDFPEVLVNRMVSSAEGACSELVKRCAEANIDEQFSLGLSYHDEACVLEITYNKDVPLDPTRPEETESNAQDGEQIEMRSLWLRVVKHRMDRVFFRHEGGRRVLEMRIYRRSEGKAERHWLMGLTARIRKEVKIDIQRDENGNPVSTILQDLKSGKVLMMDPGGTFIVERLDGKHTFHDIYMEFIDKISLTSPELLAMVFSSLEEAGMLESQERDVKRRSVLGKLTDTVNKVFLRSLNIPNSDRIVNNLYGHVKWLFNPVSICVILLFALSGFIPLAHEIAESHFLLSKPILAIYYRPLVLIELLVLISLVAMLHEFAHALTCKHFGGNVHRIGIMFYLCMVIFFADASAAWGFRSKWKRIAVAAAGPILNLVVMSACFWIWHLERDDVQPEHCIWFLLGLFCLFSTVLNFMPFIKMDGYYMLADLTGMPTLREKSFAYLRQKLFGLFGFGSKEKQFQPEGREKWILWSYGLAGTAFGVLFIAYPVIEFIHFIIHVHSGKAMTVFLGVIVALMLYSGVHSAYQTVHSRLHGEIVIL